MERALGAHFRDFRDFRRDLAYAFIPDLPLNKEWTDAELYMRYGLNKDEIAFIESQVAEHDADLFDEAAADETEDE